MVTDRAKNKVIIVRGREMDKIGNKKENFRKRKKVKKELRIGTWNIRGSFEEGKLSHLAREIRKYNFDIVALRETKQLGQKIREIEDYVFLNNGGRNRILGTGFMVKKDLKTAIIDF